MRVLFAHDGPIQRDEYGNFYGIAHNDDTFRRYYRIAEKIAVVIRVKDIDKVSAVKKYSKISVSPFEVIESPNISSVKGMIIKRYEAKKIIKKEVMESDFVIARLPSVIGFLAIDYARKYNRPYFVEMVACPWDAYWNHSVLGKIIAPIMYQNTRKRVKKADYVLYVTNEFLQKRYPTLGLSVNCSDVALMDFDDSVLNKRLKKISNMNADSKIVIGTTAAVDVKYKGQRYIIEAMGRLKKQGVSNIEYQLVGGGDQEYLKKLAQKFEVLDQVEFLGPLPHSQVFNWLDTIDIYTQPSRQEGLPRALIEAMSRALPSFGAKTAGIPELLDNDFIFNNNINNIKEICSILLKFDKKKLQEQAIRNFNEAKKYEKDLIEDKRNEFYRLFKLDGKAIKKHNNT